MTWHGALVRLTAIAALAAAIAGCLPNRGAVSPDGGTFYFSLNKEAGFEAKDGSNIYALDVETGRLRALTDGPEVKGWCSVSSDGKFLIYGTLASGGGTVAAVDLEKGNTIPVTGVTQNYAYPWVVPGSPRYVVAMTQKPERKTQNSEHGTQKSVIELQWVLFGEHGDVPLAPLADFGAGAGNVGVAPSRFAVSAGRTSKSGEKDISELSVWVVDLSNPPQAEAAKAEGNAPASPAKPWPAITCAAKWTEDATDKGGGGLDLAFSPDGKRLVAAVTLAGGDKEQGAARFFDVDPTGKEQPKLLFEVPGGRSPQLTADGSGIVYLRLTGNDEGREVLLWRPDLKEARVIARLPGVLGRGPGEFGTFTTCWTKEGGLRIYHVSDEGLWLVEAAADGTDAKARRLPRERMEAQKYLADFERGLGHVPDAPPENLPEPLADAMRAVGKPLEDAARTVQDALKAAWAAASVWDDVPAVGPLAAPAKPAAEEKNR